ncbi:RNA 3'-terminal phosphate cyclase isoform X2 [Bicyclus anynana]|nr:RNA 3'-terminal phosphate cyclase isoform X2 [Bicyclus anynana]
MCQAKLQGTSIGSTEVEFIPGKLRGGHYVADTKTAGSISLLLQVALPCALFADAPVRLQLTGGTNADMAPQIDYMAVVFRAALRRFGADFHIEILRRGYFPKGGGQVLIEVNPIRSLNCVNLTERGDVQEISGTSFVAGTLPIKLAHLMADGALRELSSKGSGNIHRYKEDHQLAPDNCNGIILSCTLSSGCVLGSDALGKRGVDATDVGRRAGEELRRTLDSGACVDPHTQDQVIVYMALAQGRSAVRAGDVTLHTTTAIHVAETIANVKFNITPDGEQNLIECIGLGFINRNLIE